PVIVKFQCEVPAGIFDCALSSLDWAKDISPSLKSVAKPDNCLRLMTRFHRLDDLASIPLSAVRKTGHTLTTNSLDEMLIRSTFDSIDVPPRRSNTFLRFIVGQRITPETKSLSTRAGKALPCSDFAYAM